MTAKKQATKVFSPEAFGKELRNSRRTAGYSSTPKFSEAIKEKTGIYIDHETLHRIERGEREPDITKLIAMSATLADTSKDKNKETIFEKIEDLLMSSIPIDLYFSDSTIEQKYISEYRKKFNREPTVDHVLSVFAVFPVVPQDQEIEGTKEEKLFGMFYRKSNNISEYFARNFIENFKPGTGISLKEITEFLNQNNPTR